MRTVATVMWKTVADDDDDDDDDAECKLAEKVEWPESTRWCGVWRGGIKVKG